MKAVDTFFKTPSIVNLTDDFQPGSRSRRSPIKALPLDEANEIFGISKKDDLFFKRRLKRKYENKK